MKRLVVIIVAVVLCLSVAGVYADEVVYSESFEEGVPGWRAYNAKPPQATITVEGHSFLQAEIPSGRSRPASSSSWSWRLVASPPTSWSSPTQRIPPSAGQ